MAFIFADGSGTTLDIAPGSPGKTIYRLKELLKTAGWTHEASSDGSNVSNTSGNANDQITADTEMDTANAWIVLSQPAIARGIGYPGNRQLILRRGTTTGLWLFSYVPAASDGTKQAKTANGTTAAIPTFTTSKIFHGTGPDTGIVWCATSASRRFIMGADNAAPYGFYCFGYLATINQAQYTQVGGHLFMDFVQPSSMDPRDQDGAVVWASHDNCGLQASGEQGGLGCPLASSNGAGPGFYVRKNLTGETWVYGGALAYALTNGSGTLMLAVPGGIGRSPYGTDLVDPQLPFIYASGAENAAGAAIADSGNSPACIKGDSYMLGWRMGAYPLGFLLKRHTAGDRAVIGELTVPWDGSTVPAVG